MVDEVWTVLWRLQELDSNQFRLLKERRAAPGPEQRAYLASIMEASAKRLKESDTKLSQAGSTSRRLELDLGEIEEHLARTEGKLYGGTGNPKEIAQLEQRVGEEKTQRGKLEEKLLALMEEIEQQERFSTSINAEAETAQKTLAEFNREYKKQTASDAALDHEYKQARQALLLQLPDQQKERYERIHARLPGSALVRIEQGNCGGCHNALAQAEIERVVRLPGSTVCDNCGRLLAPPEG